MNKRGVSQVLVTIILVVLAITIVMALSQIVLPILKHNSEISNARTELVQETLKIKKVSVNPSDPLDIDITFCCASGDISSGEVDQGGDQVIENPVDLALVIDRSGSMAQSGWNLDLNSISSSNEFLEVIVPRGGYSATNTFTVPPGTQKLAVLLNWGQAPGYNGSEGSEFALNLKRPSGTWIFGTNKPGVGGIVDPPTDVAGPNEYFSGISTKPQVVYIENPEAGDWDVKVYGWNLRPSTNRPDFQEVNISSYVGTSSQIVKNPTVISIDAAKDSARNFVNSLRANDSMAYIVFGSYSVLLQSLTSDSGALLDAIDNTGMQGGTAINTGILEAANDLILSGRPNVEKIMIVLTDGQNDAGPTAVLQEATNAKNQGIVIYTVGLTGFVDADMLKSAATTPAHYFYASDASVLESVFASVRQTITRSTVFHLTSDQFKIVFYNDTDSYVTLIPGDLKPLETKVYNFNLNGKLTNPTHVEIYAVKILSNDEQFTGPLLQTYSL